MSSLLQYRTDARQLISSIYLYQLLLFLLNYSNKPTLNTIQLQSQDTDDGPVLSEGPVEVHPDLSARISYYFQHPLSFMREVRGSYGFRRAISSHLIVVYIM